MAERLNSRTAEMGYLLGTLSEQETARLEEEFVADDAKLEELEVAEDDLIDAYVREELSNEDKRRFQLRLLNSPRIVERVNFARALAERTSLPLAQSEEAPQLELSASEKAQKTKPRWWEKLFGAGPNFRLAAVAYVVLILFGGVLVVSGWLVNRQQSAQLAAERAEVQRQKESLDKQSSEQQATAQQLTAELQRQRDQLAEDRKLLDERLRGEERSPSILGSIASVFLTPGISRSTGAGAELRVGPDTATAQLKLALAGTDYRSYDVSIKTVDDKVVFSQKALRPRKTNSGAVLAISVPTRSLPPGDYTAHVDGLSSSGLENVDDYSFRVLKAK